MNEKRVVTVIVEGPSDENAIGGILKEFFANEEVQFVVVHGDITSDFNTSADNVVSKIDDLVESIRSKYGYQWDDFLRIIHIADTDGAFTKDCVKEVKVDSIRYYADHIEYSSIEEVERRNKHKSDIMFKLYSTGNIHGIYYRLYFNSCNLEHVLYNELRDFSDREKEELSDEFAEKFEGRIQDFIEFISDESVAVAGAYKETWKFIAKEKNSLHRHSNMHLIFERE